MCEVSGFAPDPYVLNSRGNVHGSLGNWDKAKDDYESAANLFQGARGFKVGASTTQRLDGAIYAFSNLALAEAQLGNEEKALKQLESLVRRAPNSADVRAACAALYYSAKPASKTPKMRGNERVRARVAAPNIAISITSRAYVVGLP